MKLLKVTEAVEKEVSALARKICNGSNSPAFVFLDTGAVIDFERTFGRLSIPHFYSDLRGFGASLLVPRGIFEEVWDHHENHRYQGRPEVSDESMGAVGEMYDNFQRLFGRFFVSELLEKVRYDTYWAAQLAFPNGHKKNHRDPISVRDRELIASVFYVRSLLDGNDGIGQTFLNSHDKCTSALGDMRTVVISPDCHIKETVRVMCDTHPTVRENYPDVNWRFGYGEVRYISSR